MAIGNVGWPKRIIERHNRDENGSSRSRADEARLRFIKEEAPIQRAPNPISIFCANAQCAPVLEPEVFKPSQRIPRSEEHTSELQSRENLVCRLLLEKKK